MNRERLPKRRANQIYSMEMVSPELPEGLKIHVSLGRYPDGRCGEINVAFGKTGGMMRDSLEAWARLASLALQYGVPAADLCRSLRGIAGMGGRVRAPGLAVDGQAVTSPWGAVAALLEAEV